MTKQEKIEGMLDMGKTKKRNKTCDNCKHCLSPGSYLFYGDIWCLITGNGSPIHENFLTEENDCPGYEIELRIGRK